MAASAANASNQPRVKVYYPVHWTEVHRVNEEMEKLPSMESVCVDPKKCKIHGHKLRK